MTSLLQGRPTGIFLLAEDDALAELVGNVGRLVGVDVTCVSNSVQLPPNPTAVLVQAHSGANIPEGLPVLTIARAPEKADLQLPHDLPVLAQTLVQAGHTLPESPQHTLFVAGWQGGVGVSTVARQLAKVSGALLLDASGHPPGIEVKQSDLHWGKINASDPPVRSELAARIGRSGLRRGIVSRLPDCVQAGDPRVLAMLGSTDGPVVVDAGVWSPPLEDLLLGSLAAGRSARSLLIGAATADGCMRLLNVLSSGPPLWHPQMLLTAKKISEELQIVADHWQIPVARQPRGGTKRWLKLWKKVTDA